MPCLALTLGSVCTRIVGKYATESLLVIYSILPCSICLPQTGVDIRLTWKVESNVLVPMWYTLSVCTRKSSVLGGRMVTSVSTVLVVDRDSVMGTIMTEH